MAKFWRSIGDSISRVPLSFFHFSMSYDDKWVKCTNHKMMQTPRNWKCKVKTVDFIDVLIVGQVMEVEETKLKKF